MCHVRLLYAANELAKDEGLTRQELFFLVAVENIEFAKTVEIVWAGSDGVWHTTSASFHSISADDSEIWSATERIRASSNAPLPRNIQFAVRYRVGGKEYWDDNGGRKYFSPVRSSLRRAGAAEVLNLGFQRRLAEGQRSVPVAVAVNAPCRAREVSIHWTTDDWVHVHVTRCRLKSRLVLENGDRIVDDGVQLWSAQLEVGDSFRLQYSVCCRTRKSVLWDNNFGQNYSASRKPLNVLVLNLHCRQEDNQDEKFHLIAKAIDELRVDVVCLQEVSENWNDGKGDWQSNSARIINERLKRPFHIHADWSHLGFDRYREGVAILSRYPIVESGSRYLSSEQDPYSIHSRKVVMGHVPVPYLGGVDFFSVHASWWKDGFAEQFQNLRHWAESRNGRGAATLLCGDFNISAGSEGYQFVVNSDFYDDEFLAVRSPEVFAKIFRDRREDWPHLLADDGRIDYVFKARASVLRATAARFIFNEREYGRVSDHEGLLMTFEPA